MSHYPQSSVQSPAPEDRAGDTSQPRIAPANEGAFGAQLATRRAAGASPDPDLEQAVARASQVVNQAQILCDQAEAQIHEGNPADLEGYVYALNLQIGLVGHLLDCALKLMGNTPVRSSLAEWLAVGDVDAAVAQRAGVSHG